VIPLDHALRIVDETLAGAVLPCQSVPTRQAAGRVLACEQCSCVDLPPFDKAAVDGYAIRATDCGGEYAMAATIAAGQLAAGPLRPGEAVKVMTGAPVPQGTERVVMQEDAELCGETVRLKPRGPSNFCKQGEDMRRGGVVLPAGTSLRPLDVANLVGCGISSVEVVRRPRVSIISTGNEIVDDPALLSPGKIMNTNGPLLAGLCAAHGLDVVSETAAPDTPQDARAATRIALGQADIVILSGGVSVGQFDFVLDALSQIGLRVHFSRLAVKPGKPTVFATRENKASVLPVVLGLPGNPVAVFLMFHLFVLRAAGHLTGAAVAPRAFSLALAAPFKRRHGERAEFVPARLTREGRVEPIAYHGSAHLLALTRADGFFSAPAGSTELAAGEVVEFLMLPEHSQ